MDSIYNINLDDEDDHDDDDDDHDDDDNELKASRLQPINRLS